MWASKTLIAVSDGYVQTQCPASAGRHWKGGDWKTVTALSLCTQSCARVPLPSQWFARIASHHEGHEGHENHLGAVGAAQPYVASGLPPILYGASGLETRLPVIVRQSLSSTCRLRKSRRLDFTNPISFDLRSERRIQAVSSISMRLG